RPGWRRLLRPEDLRPGQGRDRPHLADVDHPVRLQPAGRLRPRVHRRRRRARAAGHDPLGEVRVDRALLRRPHRALRRRLPGLAGPGAGGRHPDHRRAGALPRRRRGEAEAARRPGGDRRLRRPDAEEDPHREQAEDPVRPHRRCHRRRGGRGVLPLPRRVAAQRGRGRRGGAAGRRLDRLAVQRRPLGRRRAGRDRGGRM
ncbi:MAG: Threonyl-tRNA synthetase, partial [uncultured Nocardioidaceae bacterium]